MRPFKLMEYLEYPDQKIITAGGLPVRIICTDRMENGMKNSAISPVIALVKHNDIESVYYYSRSGHVRNAVDVAGSYDLFFEDDLPPYKKEGWVNVYKKNESYLSGVIFSSRETAKTFGQDSPAYVDTVQIVWTDKTRRI